jgi:hypothetical protein
MKFCVLGVGDGLGAISGGGNCCGHSSEFSFGWVGVERRWGEVVEGEGGILGRGM